ncbi:MAG: hypothetical protein WD595_02335 [Waddliaceae bacterium]
MYRELLTTTAIGLESGTKEIKVANVSIKGNAFKVDSLFTVSEESLNFPESTLIATSLNDVWVRPLKMVLQKEKEIDQALEFEIEPHLPFPVNEAILNRVIVEKSAEGSKLTVLAARISQIKEHLLKWNDLGIDPEKITATADALATFCRRFVQSLEPLAVIHINDSYSTCALIKQGKLLASKGISISPEDPTFHNQILRLYLSLSKQRRERPERILFTGLLVPDLAETLDAPSLLLDTMELHSYALPIGTALSALEESSVDFRKKEFVYPNPWKRFKKPILMTAALSLTLAISFSFFGNMYLEIQRDQLRTQYTSLLSLMKKPYSEFEKQFQNSDEDVRHPQDLSEEDLRDRLNHLEGELVESPDIFALYPNTPKVSDLLAWLCTHPLCVGEGETPLLNLKGLSYKIVKHPGKYKPKEKYQIKVELDFTSDLPRYAREFHDMLLSPNGFVDPTQEVGWNTRSGTYHATFFLKDYTRYP